MLVHSKDEPSNTRNPSSSLSYKFSLSLTLLSQRSWSLHGLLPRRNNAALLAEGSLKELREIGLLYCPMADNIWQHKGKSSLGKIRLLCALEEAERRGNRSRPQPERGLWNVERSQQLCSHSRHTIWASMWPRRRIGTADYGAERLQNRKL